MQIKQGFSFILLHIDTQFSNSCKKLSFFPLVFPPLSKNHLTIHLRIYFQVLYCVQQGFPDSSVGKESTCNAGDPCSITGLGRSIQEGIGYPLQYSGLENSMDCTVHGVTKSWTRLSDFHFHFSLCSTEFVLMSVLCYFDHCSFEVCFGIRTYETSNFVFSSRLLCSFAVP